MPSSKSSQSSRSTAWRTSYSGSSTDEYFPWKVYSFGHGCNSQCNTDGDKNSNDAGTEVIKMLSNGEPHALGSTNRSWKTEQQLIMQCGDGAESAMVGAPVREVTVRRAQGDITRMEYYVDDKKVKRRSSQCPYELRPLA